MKHQSSTNEAIKWVALVLMVGDHINAALFDREFPLISELARIVFPMFGFVFAHNLARFRIEWGRLLTRLLIVAAIAQPFHLIVFGGWLPFNIMFTFAAAVAVLMLARNRSFVAAGVTLIGSGFFVDYAWPGILLIVSGYGLARAPLARVPWLAIVTDSASLIGLDSVNQNLWALGAIPVLALIAWLIHRTGWQVPRLKWVFYLFYPLHLAVLALIVLL